jgi:L-iditol 2-dehydrogenase
VDQIRVGVMTSPGKVEIREVSKPKACAGRVLVRIEASGICTTEQRIFSGAQHWERFPYVGGHEAVGTVEAIGPDTDTEVQVGDRVALFSATCGHCHNCRRGQSSKCQHRDAFWEHAGLWGTWGFSEYRLVRPRGLQPIDPSIPLEQAALAEPLSCAVHGLRRCQVELGDEVVVIGAGAMGLLNALAFSARGAVVTVLDLQESRCRRALDAGVARAFVPDESTRERIHAFSGGRGPDLVVVASSSVKAYELARTLLGPLGQLLAFAAVYPSTEDHIDWTQVHRSELRLFGAVSSDIEDIQIAGRVISSRMLDLPKAIETVVPFDRFAEAMALAVQPDTYRVVLRM